MMIQLSFALVSLLAVNATPVHTGAPVLAPAIEGEDEGQKEELLLAIYDLRAILPRIDVKGWEQSLMLPPAGRGRHHLPEAGSDKGGFYASSSGDVIMKIISRALEDEFLERGRDLSLQDEQSLLLLAPQTTHAKVEGIVNALRGMASDAAVVRVDILSSSDPSQKLPANNVVAASEVDRIIAQAGSSMHHESFELQLEPGRTTLMDQRETISLLFDYDVEIAQGAFVFDPVVLQTQEGLRILMRASPAGGGLAMNCVFQTSQVDQNENHPIRLAGMVNREDAGMAMVQGPQVLQNPSVLVHSFSVNTFLPDGKALLFASETVLAGEIQRQVIAVRKVQGNMGPYISHPIAGTGRRLLMVNAELFRSPMIATTEGPYRGDFRANHPLLTSSLQSEPSHFFLGWMRNFAVWDRLGPWVLIVTDRSWDGDNEKKLEALVNSRQESPALASVEIELQASAGDRPVRCSLPIRVGSQAGLAVGKTRTVLFDFNVEVAAFSAVADPMMLSTFDGMAVTLSVLEGRGLERVLVVDGAAHLVRKQPSEIHLQGSVLGRLELPRYDILKLDERRTLPGSDGANRVKLGPASDDNLVLNVTVK